MVKVESNQNCLSEGELKDDYQEKESELEEGECANDDEEDHDDDYEAQQEFSDETDDSDSENENAASEKGDKKARSRKRLIDDGDLKYYQKRMKDYFKENAKIRLDNILPDGTERKDLDKMVTIDGPLQIPEVVWNALYQYQQTGVKWLWELHQLSTGGIIGDEMGLGKTIQVIAFLTALRTSRISSYNPEYEELGPVVLVCPATLMHQWLLEFRRWWPEFRVAILHNTGSFSGKRVSLIGTINKARGILVTSYQGAVIYQDVLHKYDWHYAILDEGHKIRNPDAQVTLACKRFRTPHRIILTGSPIQNNLKELWSIFDFIYPGKLGTLPVFMEQFAIPITQGGYANASDFQVQIAYKCACVVRDAIKPYLLRRTKQELNDRLKLPEKSEQVLFCKLTDQQRKMYEAFLKSPTVRDIHRGSCQIFVGLIEMRKICNHPDLFDASDVTPSKSAPNDSIDAPNKNKMLQYGYYKKSGKMMVVDALLKLWHQQGQKVLLFTQSRKMLKIVRKHVETNQYTYLFMDGATPIGARQLLVEKFNTDPQIFIFLLTTRVGGIGINLTGANRIIIYDPDWNPSTDMQARERAWRIGQTRQVTIYRLLTAGTIEEKIYHRQVFKLYLTNRILKDAKQKRFFKTNDLHELFTLGDPDGKGSETGALFDEEMHVRPGKSYKRPSSRESHDKNKKRHGDRREERKVNHDDEENSLFESVQPKEVKLSEEKIKEMRERARQLSLMIARKFDTLTTDKSVEGGDVGSSSNKINDNEHTDKGTIVCDKAKQDDSATKEYSNRKQHKSKNIAKDPLLEEHLVRQEEYKPAKYTNKKSAKNDRDENEYILKSLFKKTDIKGALAHDKIEADSCPDYKIVENEAEKVAHDAIKALKASRRLCLRATSGIPNWTGANGQVSFPTTASIGFKVSRRQALGIGRKASISPQPTQSNAAASTSSEQKPDGSLLSAIRRRNCMNPVVPKANRQTELGLGSDTDDDDDDTDPTNETSNIFSSDPAFKVDEMVDEIRTFVAFRASRDGEANTEELLEFFKRSFHPSRTPVFKALLHKLCDFEKRGKQGFWRLKTDYR